MQMYAHGVFGHATKTMNIVTGVNRSLCVNRGKLRVLNHFHCILETQFHGMRFVMRLIDHPLILSFQLQDPDARCYEVYVEHASGAIASQLTPESQWLHKHDGDVIASAKVRTISGCGQLGEEERRQGSRRQRRWHQRRRQGPS